MIDKLPNIYTILDRMDFDKQSEHMRNCIIRHYKGGLSSDSLDYNTKQHTKNLTFLFYFL